MDKRRKECEGGRGRREKRKARREEGEGEGGREEYSKSKKQGGRRGRR